MARFQQQSLGSSLSAAIGREFKQASILHSSRKFGLRECTGSYYLFEMVLKAFDACLPKASQMRRCGRDEMPFHPVIRILYTEGSDRTAAKLR